LKRGAKILVFREDGPFSRQLRARGHDVENVPLIGTRPLADLSRFRELLEKPERFDGIFVTSHAAAELLAEQLEGVPRDKVPLIFVHGARSRELLKDRGLRLEFRESANTADEFMEELGVQRFSGQHLLFVRGDKSLRVIPERLGEVAKVDEAVVYETVEMPVDTQAAEKLRNVKDFDWLCFFSPSAVESFVSRGLASEGGIPRIAVIGETTGKAVTSSGLEVDHISEGASQREFAEGLARHIGDN
jgi:uroporphyrinogen-III synthase